MNTEWAMELRHAGVLQWTTDDEGLTIVDTQFGLDGDAHPAVADVVLLARDRGWSDRDLMLWLVLPNDELPGQEATGDLIASPHHDAVIAALRGATRTAQNGSLARRANPTDD